MDIIRHNRPNSDRLAATNEHTPASILKTAVFSVAAFRLAVLSSVALSGKKPIIRSKPPFVQRTILNHHD